MATCTLECEVLLRYFCCGVVCINKLPSLHSRASFFCEANLLFRLWRNFISFHAFNSQAADHDFLFFRSCNSSETNKTFQPQNKSAALFRGSDVNFPLTYTYSSLFKNPFACEIYTNPNFKAQQTYSGTDRCALFGKMVWQTVSLSPPITDNMFHLSRLATASQILQETS